MMLVEGQTDGGKLAQLLDPEQVPEWIAQMDRITRKAIVWTVTPVQATDLRSATTEVNSRAKVVS